MFPRRNGRTEKCSEQITCNKNLRKKDPQKMWLDFRRCVILISFTTFILTYISKNSHFFFPFFLLLAYIYIIIEFTALLVKSV